MWLDKEKTKPYGNDILDNNLDSVGIFNLFRTRTNELLNAVLKTCDVVQKEVDKFSLDKRTLTYYSKLPTDDNESVQLSLHIHSNGFSVGVTNSNLDDSLRVHYTVVGVDMNFSWGISDYNKSMMTRIPGYNSYYETFSSKIRDCIETRREDFAECTVIAVQNIDMAISHAHQAPQRKRNTVVYRSNEMDDDAHDYYQRVDVLEYPVQEDVIFNAELLHGKECTLMNCAAQGIGAFTNSTISVGMAIRSSEFCQSVLDGLQDIEDTIWNTILTTETSSPSSP